MRAPPESLIPMTGAPVAVGPGQLVGFHERAGVQQGVDPFPGGALPPGVLPLDGLLASRRSCLLRTLLEVLDLLVDGPLGRLRLRIGLLGHGEASLAALDMGYDQTGRPRVSSTLRTGASPPSARTYTSARKTFEPGRRCPPTAFPSDPLTTRWAWRNGSPSLIETFPIQEAISEPPGNSCSSYSFL